MKITFYYKAEKEKLPLHLPALEWNKETKEIEHPKTLFTKKKIKPITEDKWNIKITWDKFIPNEEYLFLHLVNSYTSLWEVTNAINQFEGLNYTEFSGRNYIFTLEKGNEGDDKALLFLAQEQVRHLKNKTLAKFLKNDTKKYSKFSSCPAIKKIIKHECKRRFQDDITQLL